MLNSLFYLLRYAIDADCEEMELNIDRDTWIKIYKLAKKHDLVHLISYSVSKLGIAVDADIKAQLDKEMTVAIFRYERMQYELEELCRVLEEAEIPHIPLKGSVLREYYPEPWMRTSCDVDILVKKKDVKKAINVLKTELEYTYSGENSHDVQLWSPSDIHMELHFSLIEDYIHPSNIDVLGSVWEDARTVDGMRYSMRHSDEFFYFYHIAHMAKHLMIGGCGIRPFMDIWILNHRKDFDEQARIKLLEKGDLFTFEQKAMGLAKHWFSDEEHTELTRQLEQYVFNGGMYGGFENKQLVTRGQQGSKFKFLLQKVFMPYGNLCYIFPKLEGRKWLYPYYTVRRWIMRVFQGKVRSSVNEVKMANSLSDDKVKQTESMMKELGLM